MLLTFPKIHPLITYHPLNSNNHLILMLIPLLILKPIPLHILTHPNTILSQLMSMSNLTIINTILTHHTCTRTLLLAINIPSLIILAILFLLLLSVLDWTMNMTTVLVALWDWYLIFRKLHQLLLHQCSFLDIIRQVWHHLLEFISQEEYHKTVVFLLLLLLVLSFLDWTVILLLCITV